MRKTPFPDESYFLAVRSQLQQDFQEKEMLAAGDAILEYLATTDPESERISLSFGAMRNVIKRRSDVVLPDDKLLSIAAYFVGGRARLLDMDYHFRDPETHEFYEKPISSEKVMRAYQTQKFTHPEFEDENVPDFEACLVVRYRPSDVAALEYKKLHKGDV